MSPIEIRASMAVVGEGLEVVRDRCIVVRGGVIESIAPKASCSDPAVKGDGILVVPQPANAHVHSGDHAFPEFGGEASLEELVAPPHGLKHRLLESISFGELTFRIEEFYRLAWKAGTGLLVDFREGGGAGCRASYEALKRLGAGMRVLVLGRPGPMWPEYCDGLGLPTTLIYRDEEIRELVARRPAMVHVAEDAKSRSEGDFEAALRHGFDAIVHGVYLSPEDIRAVKERGMGMVFCARSNMWHSIGKPPIREAIVNGVPFGIGTDNGAWTPPDIWGEAYAALLVAVSQGLPRGASSLKILEALFIDGYRIAGQEPPVIDEGAPARLVVLDASGTGILNSVNPYFALVKRIPVSRVIARVDGDKLSFIVTAR